MSHCLGGCGTISLREITGSSLFNSICSQLYVCPSCCADAIIAGPCGYQENVSYQMNFLMG